MALNKKKAGAAAMIPIAIISGFIFSQRSRLNLAETRPQLQAVSECAIKRTTVDFVVVDGGRTQIETDINRKNGKSWVKVSRHQSGAAIDFAAFVDKKITYEAKYYKPIADAFYSCSTELKVPIIWGGTWKVQDLMHIELDRKVYP